MLLKTLRTSLRTLLKTLLRTYKYDAYVLPGMKALEAYRHDTLLDFFILFFNDNNASSS